MERRQGSAVEPPIAKNDVGKRQQLPDEVASYVRELVVSGTVRSGELLRLESIAEALGMSSTPVREGLLALTREGFVTQAPRRGFVVAPFTREDIRDLFWAQSWMGGELAARAAKRVTAEQLERAEKIVEAYETAHEVDDIEAIAKLGHLFHREINIAADSMRLATLLGSVVRALPNRFYSTIEGAIEGTREAHPLIIEALRNRDAKVARQLMEEHISNGADRLIKSLELQGLWSETLQS